METADRKSFIASLVNPRQLHLIILPTEQCNFRCTYCYEDFSIGRMRPPLVAGLKALLNRRIPELSTLEISWFGGEPLMAKDIVLDVSAAAAEAARAHPDLHYSGGMTTNAYLLTPELLQRLVDVGVRSYQITLDGWGETHDVTRRRADGHGTFERVWRHLLQMRQSDFELQVLIRMHLTPQNRDSIGRLFEQLLLHFGPDLRFDLLCKEVGNWGGPNAGAFAVLPKDEGKWLAAELQARWSSERAARPVGPATAPLPYVCYAARPNSLVIRADGSVGKCTVMLKDGRNRLGELREDGTLALRSEQLMPWLRGLRSAVDAELSCPAKGLPKAADGLQLL